MTPGYVGDTGVVRGSSISVQSKVQQQLSGIVAGRPGFILEACSRGPGGYVCNTLYGNVSTQHFPLARNQVPEYYLVLRRVTSGEVRLLN